MSHDSRCTEQSMPHMICFDARNRLNEDSKIARPATDAPTAPGVGTTEPTTTATRYSEMAAQALNERGGPVNLAPSLGSFLQARRKRKGKAKRERRNERGKRGRPPPSAAKYLVYGPLNYVPSSCVVFILEAVHALTALRSLHPPSQTLEMAQHDGVGARNRSHSQAPLPNEPHEWNARWSKLSPWQNKTRYQPTHKLAL